MSVFGVGIDKLAIGLVAGIAVLLVLVGADRWRNRQAYGYSVYRADSMRRMLIGWGIGGMVLAAGLGVFVLFRMSIAPAGTPVLEAITGVEVAQARYYADYALNIGEVGVQRAPVIEIPFVGQTWDTDKLGADVGHLAGSMYPGQGGNIVLAGHVTIPGAGWGPFSELETIEDGTKILIEFQGDLYEYEVVNRMKVSPSDVRFALPTDREQLTLITCADFVGTELDGFYESRWVVVAYPVEVVSSGNNVGN